jgi:hypothetical protein
MIQIRSIDKPFRSPVLYQRVVEALKRADAMGLLPQDEVIENLDVKTLSLVLRHLAKAGIGRHFSHDLVEPSWSDAAKLEKLLGQLTDALEESPVPAHEWHRLADVLGVDQLAQLLGISPSSVRRYKAHARTTPDDVAARLHFLALIVGDLAGAYNDIGIRRWFERARTLLDNRSPAQLLRREWSPNDPGPRKVRDLARSLVTAPAT